MALFQRTTDNKIDSEHTLGYTKLFSVCKVEILQVSVNTIEIQLKFYHLFSLISDDFELKVLK